MTTVVVQLRRYYLVDKSRYWAYVRPIAFKRDIWFQYDTPSFDTVKEALDEARAFCKWKGLKIRKIEKEIK